MYKQKYPDEKYLETEFFLDRDLIIKNRQIKLVITRKEHMCAFGYVIGKEHTIPIGKKVYFEKAVVEGEWGSCYSCLECLDTWLDEIS